MGVKILSGNRTFNDRTEAGDLLAEELIEEAPKGVLVLGIPRGGVAVAFPVAERLGAELDVVVARKLRAPWNPELAIGAVMEGGETYLNRSLISGLGVSDDYVREETQRELEQIAERIRSYRKVREFVPREGRRLIVVDDGVATGATMIATLRGLRAARPASLCCALPVGPRDTLDALADIADDVLCLCCPAFFQAVGQFYRRFDQTPNEDVVELLRRSVAG